MSITSIEYLKSLVRELVKLPTETERVEFKCNNKEPQLMGEYISALSNSATLCGRTKGYPDKERALWQAFDTTPYELRLAKSYAPEDELVVLLDYPKYYDKMEMPIPRNRDKVLDDLQNEKFIVKNDAGNLDITNMGALVIAKDLKKFDNLHRRSVHKCGICEERGS